MRRVVVCVLTAAVLGMGAQAAHAASIVYIKDANVWLANPDGSGQYQVTTDGTATSPYKSPSQANDGTIMALNSGRLFRMAQNGQWLNEPIATAASGGGPLSPEISPNGAFAVFDYITTTSGGFQQETIYSYADRLTQRTEIDPAGFDLNDPSWIDDGRTMLFAGQQVWTEPVGPGDQTLWFDEFDTIGDPGANLSDGETAGTGVVVVRGSGEGESLQFYRRNGGGFDADPTPICTFSEPTGAFADPTLAPGGSAVAWQEGDGVWTSAFPGDDCAGAAPRLTIPGGSQPDYGPANVNPGPRRPPPVCCVPPPPDGGVTLYASAKKRIKLRALLRKGLRVRFTCSGTCAVIAELRVAKRAAKRYKLPRKLGRGSGATAGPAKTLTVKLGKRAKRKLRKARGLKRLKLTLVLSYGNGIGGVSTTRRSVVVRR